MGKCEDCGADIDDNYKVCFPCSNKRKQSNNGTSDVVGELGKLNNNLYALRTMQEFILKETFKHELAWNKKEKRFDINKIKAK